ncbi:MAG: hypothetical protein WC069_03440 [Candidatus Shapirobacteria bacterium]
MENITNPISEIPVIVEHPKTNYLTLILISLCFVLFVSGAYYLGRQSTVIPTTNPVGLLPKTTIVPTVTNVPISNWKTYPPDSTIGLPFSFNYPLGASLIENGEGPISISQNSTTIYFNYYGKAKGIENLINNYQPLHTPKKLIFFNKQPILSGSLSGFIMNVPPVDVIVNDTYVFLTHNNNDQQIFEFSYSSKDKNAYFMLIQILSSFEFTESNVENKNLTTYTDTKNLGFSINYPSNWKVNTWDGNGVSFDSDMLAVGMINITWNMSDFSTNCLLGKFEQIKLSNNTISMCHNKGSTQEPESYYFVGQKNGKNYSISTSNYPGDDKRNEVLKILSSLEI